MLILKPRESEPSSRILYSTRNCRFLFSFSSMEYRELLVASHYINSARSVDLFGTDRQKQVFYLHLYYLRQLSSTHTQIPESMLFVQSKSKS